MVHVKRLELTNFKSFGGTTSIPLLPGFTVVSGPNGSGKSNILDALLFCLGLSSSKGMRAERLPDLVNHNKAENRKATQEASVTVTLDLSDSQSDPLGRNRIPDVEEEDEEETDDPFSLANAQEWSVTRRLRVTPSGTYTSTYYINGVPATLTELHEALNRLRIYPEGYNVVLQGDVTSIISMNPRQRREIIDELAGVAQFDRKIELAKEKLDAVKEKEESSRIIEKELITQRDRLAQDRTKAEKYKKLRAELQDKEQWEVVLKWRSLQQQLWNLRDRIEAGDRTLADLNEQHTQLSTQIAEKTAELETLNRRVKALGEEELLAVQSHLATQQAELRQLEQRQRDIITNRQDLSNAKTQTERNIQTTQQTLAELQQQHADESQNCATLEISYTQAQAELEEKREAASAIADASQAWVQQQTELNHNIETLLQTLEPQRTEQAQLQERQNQLTRLIQEQHETIHTLDPEITAKQ
ncbi:MAG: AAA family ATPase, partial [Desertifilum sp. SIO1I2]|nr:AAA family ATPase [Desertifilum sp. SIO1I2]